MTKEGDLLALAQTTAVVNRKLVGVEMKDTLKVKGEEARIKFAGLIIDTLLNPTVAQLALGSAQRDLSVMSVIFCHPSPDYHKYYYGFNVELSVDETGQPKLRHDMIRKSGEVSAGFEEFKKNVLNDFPSSEDNSWSFNFSELGRNDYRYLAHKDLNEIDLKGEDLFFAFVYGSKKILEKVRNLYVDGEEAKVAEACIEGCRLIEEAKSSTQEKRDAETNSA